MHTHKVHLANTSNPSRTLRPHTQCINFLQETPLNTQTWWQLIRPTCLHSAVFCQNLSGYRLVPETKSTRAFQGELVFKILVRSTAALSSVIPALTGAPEECLGRQTAIRRYQVDTEASPDWTTRPYKHCLYRPGVFPLRSYLGSHFFR
jgi:hypothetical protein